jgi:hypothetical protein
MELLDGAVRSLTANRHSGDAVLRGAIEGMVELFETRARALNSADDEEAATKWRERFEVWRATTQASTQTSSK